MVIFEGRDSAGKGGTIKRITYRLNPRVVRVVAHSTPTKKASSDENPEVRLELRIHDPRRCWKLSTMDQEARARPFNLVPKDYPWHKQNNNFAIPPIRSIPNTMKKQTVMSHNIVDI